MATAVYNPAAEITALGKAQQTAAQIGLQTAKSKTLSDLAIAQGKIEPEYAKQRNTVSTNNQVAAKNFAEYMAQRGQNTATGNSGTMNQGEITRNAVTQGSLGTLAAGQALANTENQRQGVEAGTTYNNALALSNATINSSTMAALIQAQQTYNAAKIAQENTDKVFAAQQKQIAVENARADAALAASRSSSSGGGGGGGRSYSSGGSGGSSGGGSDLTYTQQMAQQKQGNTASVLNEIDQWASGNSPKHMNANGTYKRATAGDIDQYLKNNAAHIVSGGIDYKALRDIVKSNYTWGGTTTGKSGVSTNNAYAWK
jgi:hypothetical protein